MAKKPLPPTGEIILYPTEDGRTRVECRFSGETVWLTQALLAELYQKDVRTINEHLQNLFEEGELDPEATIRKFRTVRREGQRDVARRIEHYNLAAILAVGYRVRSPRGAQFRRWAKAREAGAFEGREVLAGEEADEVGGGEDGLAVYELHGRRLSGECTWFEGDLGLPGTDLSWPGSR